MSTETTIGLKLVSIRAGTARAKAFKSDFNAVELLTGDPGAILETTVTGVDSIDTLDTTTNIDPVHTTEKILTRDTTTILPAGGADFLSYGDIVGASTNVREGRRKKKMQRQAMGYQPVHVHVTCDGCGVQNFTGNRCKCRTCYNYDLCSACYVSSNPHAVNHSLSTYEPPHGY